MYQPNIDSFKDKQKRYGDGFIQRNPDYTYCPKHPNKYYNKKKYTKCYVCYLEESEKGIASKKTGES